MNTSTPQCSLFLHPKKQGFMPEDTSLFISQLQNTNFISKQINKQINSFYTGNRYLDYIAYLGCSPAIQFEENETSANFCKIKIHQYNTAKLITSKIQSRPPHCPNCHKPVKNWRDNQTQETIFCDLCNTNSHIIDFNWRKMAGYAHLFIEITDIFPKEAVPQQILLDQLTEIFQTDWIYFYSCR